MDKRKEENLRVKKAITNALFRLMNKKSFSDITITEIIKEAGVARVSYYRNYSSKTDILVTLVREIILEYIRDPSYDPKEYNSRRNITRILRTYRKYRRYVLDIHKAELGYVIASGLARMWHDTPEYRNMTPAERYRIVIHCGALDSMAISWLVNGMPETPEEMAEIFCSSVHS